MNRTFNSLLPLLFATTALASGSASSLTIIQDGRPRSEIIIPDNPPRMVRLAATELQTFLEKISGARLPIVTTSGERLRWQSNAEIAVHRGDDFWSLEARVPIVPEAEGAMDPVHHIIYRRAPSSLWSWHFNIGRVIQTGDTSTISSFAPNPEGNLHDRLHFGKLAR